MKHRRQAFILSAIALLLIAPNLTPDLVSNLAYAEIYKYKDDSGRWVFSDKKPETKETKVEIVDYQVAEPKEEKASVYSTEHDDAYHVVVDNPFHAPLYVELLSENKELNFKQLTAPAAVEILYSSKQPLPSYQYRLSLGPKGVEPDNYGYRVPVAPGQEYRISQSFNGTFSHTQEPNIYAVDMAMQVGTYITAAREGTVFFVKDDYHMSGRSDYFLDKANYVGVYHEDGTHAIYAHILQDSVVVKPGDKVKVGDTLARSGSSGYSTGPHLHFVIRKNGQSRTESVPFVFVDAQGQTFTPKRGMMVSSAKPGP